MDHDHDVTSAAKRAKIAWAVFAVLAAFYLWTEHQVHVLGLLPCPLMHLFMHHGHHHEPGDKPRAADGDPGGAK